jgi:hypothetical protein
MLWLTRMLRSLAGAGPSGRERPRSANGASSFHLWWVMPAGVGPEPRLSEVSAVLEVVVPPRVKALYFWALQVELADSRGVWGYGHTGLQWNRRYPDGTAVNWGGYAGADQGGVTLPGTASSLSGFPDDPNTLAYPWQPGRPYRIRVFRSPETSEGWRVEVTDLAAGIVSVVRDLTPAPGRQTADPFLGGPLVWSEVFADCDDPSVTVRWSDLRALDAGGNVVRPEAVRVSYQAYEAGGCPNTNVMVDETGGILQVTNTPRLAKDGTLLRLPPA